MIISYQIMEIMIIVDIISTIILILEITINNKYKQYYSNQNGNLMGILP